jgi:glycosyltransferase involved in cell wall biosynthesis
MKIIFLLESFTGGGVERNTLVLTSLMAARGHDVKLVVCQNSGPLKERVDRERVGLHVLQATSLLRGRRLALQSDPGSLPAMLLPVLLPVQPPKPVLYLSSLVDYLRREKPDAIVAATPHINLLAVWAKRLSGLDARLILGERIQIRHYLQERSGWRHRFLLPLIRRTYVHADTVLAVSDGVAEELAESAGLDRGLVQTVYNPVVVDVLLEKAAEPVEHPWFRAGEPPVILSVGRLSEQKDFPTLVRAFARVRKQQAARLMIIGEAGNPKKTGKRQDQLMQLAEQLGVAGDVALPGFIANPYPYMGAAKVFAMTSTYEGLPTVLIEAMACGTPVVSTNYPGANEILENGKWGELVPIADDERMAAAIVKTLDEVADVDAILSRAGDFTGDKAVDNYERVLGQ